jgi:hypothetical protein
MMRTQAEKLVERLKSACTFNRFDEPGVYAEYIRALARYDYDRMEEAIDAAIEDDSRNVPPISALIKKYRETTESRVNVKNEEYCAVCDDKGFVIMKEKQSDTGLIYEFVLYCPFCPVGRAQVYDGRNISDKEHRSPYYIPPLTQYFDDVGIEEFRRVNLERRAKKTEKERPVREGLQAIGKSMPEVKEFEDVPF